MAKSPDSVLNPNDPGDDMQRRVRYQAVRAACFILALFDDDTQVVEVFCEQHEDILVKYRTGRFRGVQVKTKLDGAVPHKARDSEVIHSIQRFIAIEKEFVGQFDGYILANNCGFWRVSQNGSNLQFILDEARGKALNEVPKSVLSYLTKLCPKPKAKKVKAPPKTKKKRSSPDTADAPTTPPPADTPIELEETHEQLLTRGLEVLQRLELDHKPSLEEMEQHVIGALACCPVVGKNQLYCDLESIAKSLIAEILEASAKPHASPKKHYFAVCQNPAATMVDSAIAAKRFARGRAEEVIRRGFRAAAVPLADGHSALGSMPKGTRTQKAKMTAGGIVIDDVDESLLQRHAAEFAMSSWLTKYGRSEAEHRYQDVRSAVLTECNAARDAVRKVGEKYGTPMLHEAKRRIHALHQAASDTLHGLRYDQLLGVAGVLTEECKVWWGEKFDLPEEVVT